MKQPPAISKSRPTLVQRWAARSAPFLRPGSKTRLAVLLFVLTIALFFLALDLAIRWVPFRQQDLFPGGTGTVVLDRHGRPLRAYLAQDDRWRLPAHPRRVSPYLIQATLAAEDQRFYRHNGVDPLAIFRATLGNLLGTGRRSGASTLTMQAVGLEDPPPRTYLRKIRQAFRALQLERHATKDQILGLYLTHAPYGGNVCGVEAAARKWLGKPASELSLAEAALLAGIPQAPSRFRPDRYPAAARRRMGIVLRRMHDEGMITRSQYLRALRQPLPIGRATTGDQAALRSLPQFAPHFCDMVRARTPSPGLVRSTLDLPTQRLAEESLRRQVDSLRAYGITNGAVVILDTATNSVRALVGSADIHDRMSSGQVNGAIANRPAGSTLKPLLYALAYDRRQLLPGEYLPDVPTVFAGYRPQNSDREFRGPVPADECLAWSLNLPAVEVLRRIGVPVALDILRSNGLDTLSQNSDRYGLSLAIGTGSVNLLDLTAACATLARGGTYIPPSVIPRSSPAQPIRSLSPEACYLVNAALASPTLRPPNEVSANLLGLDGIAWKTGTSNGMRDAWTIAWDGETAVGVWMGNFNNQSSPALKGYTAAAPLALNLLHEVRKRRTSAIRVTIEPSPWPQPPVGITTASVCVVTGALARPSCPTTVTARTIAGGGPECTVHRTVLMDTETSTLLCTRCSAGRHSRSVVRAFHSPAMAAWLIRNPPARDPLLPEDHFAGCPSQPPATGPVILHPRDGEVYLLDPTRPTQAQLLQPRTSGSNSSIIWFLNGQLLPAAHPGQTGPDNLDGAVGPRVPLTPGRHRLRAVTPQGTASEVTFEVHTIEE